jgi:hypothetical protein
MICKKLTFSKHRKGNGEFTLFYTSSTLFLLQKPCYVPSVLDKIPSTGMGVILDPDGNKSFVYQSELLYLYIFN